MLLCDSVGITEKALQESLHNAWFAQQRGTGAGTGLPVPNRLVGCNWSTTRRLYARMAQLDVQRNQASWEFSWNW